MLDIDELRRDARESYQKRFERWLAKSDLDKQIRIAAKKGNTRLRIDLKCGGYTDYFIAMANDKRFIPFLKREFPTFEIWRDDSDYKSRIGFTCTSNKVIISWK